MTKHPWHVAINKPFDCLSNILMSSAASALEACFSTHETKPFFLAGVEPVDIFEWLNDADYHKANLIYVKFEKEADATKFAAITGGQVLG